MNRVMNFIILMW